MIILLYLGWLRGFIADYGVPLMVLVWTGVSYIPYGNVPKAIPRRLFSPNPWSPGAYDNWTVIKVLKHSQKDSKILFLLM
jgi:boron transporter